MDEMAAPSSPSQILHADGTAEPFDPDRLHHTLFAATAFRGSPDAFLSRELTDSILPFLAERATGDTITTAETIEVARAVLRALGHVALAQAFHEVVLRAKADRQLPLPPEPPPNALREALVQRQPFAALAQTLAQAALTSFTLTEMYPPPLVAAHQEGLLTLGHLSSWRELGAAVARWPEREVLDWLEEQRAWLGEEVVCDAPEREWVLLQAPTEARGQALREMALGCRLLGLRLAVHLHGQEPPAWAVGADPPLFPSHFSATDERQHRLRLLFLELGQQFPDTVRLFWHVADTPESIALTAEVWPRLLRLAESGATVTLMLDHPRDAGRLHDGMDRRHTSLLQSITLHLDVLAQRQGPHLHLEAYLGKTLSLARLALSAAKTRREFLRRWRLPGWPAFVLDQAHVCLRLAGVDQAARHLAEAISPEALHHAMAQRLPVALSRAARPLNLTAMLDPGPQQLQGFTGTAEELRQLLHTARLTSFTIV